MHSSLSLPLNQPRRDAAFTLVELIVVVAVMAVILSYSASGFTSSLQSQRLGASATRLAGEHSAAQLQAIRENRSLEVRLLRQVNEFNTNNRLRGVQLQAIDPATGNASPVGEPITLDSGVVVYEDPAHSTVLNHKTTELPDGYYTLKPNGATDLSPASTEKWCLTLVLERDLKTDGALPVDHRVLVINAQTGAVRVY